MASKSLLFFLLLPLLYFSTASTLPALSHNSTEFNLALHTLLYNLKTTISSSSSKKEIYYNDIKLYALAKCVQSISTKECELCVENAINKLYKCCGTKQGGVDIQDSCMVQFESYKFYGYPLGKTSNDIKEESEMITYYEDSGKTGSYVGLRKKVILIWSGFVSCFTGIAVGTWLLRRRVVNKAKVAATDEEEGSEDH